MHSVVIYMRWWRQKVGGGAWVEASYPPPPKKKTNIPSNQDLYECAHRVFKIEIRTFRTITIILLKMLFLCGTKRVVNNMIILYIRAAAEKKFKTPTNIIQRPRAPCYFYANKVFFLCVCSGSCISKEPERVNVSAGTRRLALTYPKVKRVITSPAIIRRTTTHT